MEDWKEVKLGDLATVKGGKRLPKGSNLTTQRNSHPYIRIRDLGKSKILQLNSEYEYVDDETQKTISRYITNKGDVLISIVGTIGLIGIVGDSLDNANLTENCVKLVDLHGADTDYLYYFLISEIGQNEIARGTVGAVQPKLPIKNIQDINIYLPPLPTQQKIAQILSSLDGKIELNNKINANLEQQAQALFKSWFVDFEPFGGEMPVGWEVGTIGDLCSTVSQTYKGNDSEVVLINTSDVENGDILNHESVANSNLKGQFKKTFQRNDILYSEIRPANRHYAFVDIDETCNYIASTKLMVIRPKEDVNPHYLYHILTNPELIKEMQHLAETRSGTFPQITFENELSTYQIPLLPKEEQDKLGNLFEKIDNMVFHNIRENKKLSNLRNTLLPKLMNGEIEV